METQGLPAAEAARARPGAQHGGPAAPPAAPRRPQPDWDPSPAAAASSSSAAASGLYVSFPVLLVEEKPEASPAPSPCAPPAGPAPDNDGLLLVLNVVRGAAEAGPGSGEAGRAQPGPPPAEPPPPEEEASGAVPPPPPPPPPLPPAGGDGGGAEDGSFSGTITINNQSLVVRIENGVLTLGPGAEQAAGTAAPPPPRATAAASPAEPPGGPRPRSPPAFPCPEPRCGEAFPRKQQLRLHRLSAHGGGGGGGGGEEDRGAAARPFCCPVPGCAWSFATAYKLRRHLHSHDKLRPFACAAPGCSKRFTTVYNLRAHSRAHEQEAAHKCELCGQRFPSAARLAAHRRRSHLEPERPYRCDFPGCERTFITVSALFSHNRAHFREQEQFCCSFPGCNKQYDKACRLKIHMRSHTGERPFICDFEGCGWSFTSMSKLLRHKRKHEDDRRFMCPIEGCGKSFTRAEHLKGHSITHLGTKPFECPVEGCCAKFSARSSLYIHSKKHLQDVDSLKTRCPVPSCNKFFTSKHSMKTHMVKQHNFSPDLLTQLEATSSLTPSSELTSPGQSDLSNIDLISLFSNVSSNNSGTATDMALVNSGIVTIDVASVGSTLGGNLPVSTSSLSQAVDPLILVTSSDMPQSLDSSLLLGTSATVLQQSTLNLDDVQTVNAEALGSLASLSVRNSSQDVHGLTSSNNLTIDTAALTPSSSLGGTNVPELLTPTKAERNLLPSSDVVGQQEGSKVVTQFVFSNPPGSYSAQKEMDLGTVTGSSFLESSGSARTDYRAIQLAKKRKQKGNGSSTAASGSGQRKSKGGKVSPTNFSSSAPGSRLGGNIVLPNGGLTIRDPATGAQYVQIQLLQEPHNSTEDDAGSDNSQFTGSTINLQDLE
ncbi:zinc finger protein ZXDC isoform X3 [Pezoporus wallicus]|uniref:zinc finger protein ZXDC isoform X3 n=1 Tax=Pezoporus wallicus TaxID=35540 RepID=UPI0025513CEE|nr:zinc finger protein ZXDC isoform X3 [Pezoporus wallicus]XP_061312064.1 zinc finger protein ZXDC isoform X3 [Pezoporus flaviventris]